MNTNGESKFSFLLLGLGLGAIGGVLAMLLARKETRELLRDRSHKSMDYLSQTGNKLRRATEGIVEKGKDLMSHGCCAVDAITKTDAPHEEEPRERLVG
jgi:gas vesicle protein